jgi:hypothetical protein
MAINGFLPGFELEGTYEYRKNVCDEFAKRHPASNACAEAELQSPALLEEVNRVPARLLEVMLSRVVSVI